MRPRFVRPRSDEERAEVTQAYRALTSVDLVRRCHAVLLAADGQPIPTSARLLRGDQSVLHRWLDRVEAGGVAARACQERSGRPPRWDEAYEVTLVETVRHDPRWYGLEHSVWTCALLAGYLAQQTGIGMSAQRVRVLLHQHGMRLTQPPPVVHRRDPLSAPKGRGWR